MEIQDNFGAMILARKFKLWPFRIRNNPPRNQATSQFWRENSNFRIVNLIWFILPKVFLKRRFQICIFTFFCLLDKPVLQYLHDQTEPNKRVKRRIQDWRCWNISFGFVGLYFLLEIYLSLKQRGKEVQL